MEIPSQQCPDQPNVFDGQFANLTERLFLWARLQLGYKFDNNDAAQQQSLQIEFVDAQGNKLFEIVPDCEPIEGTSLAKYLGSSSLVDSSGKKIVIIEHRNSRPQQLKIKSPCGQYKFNAERRAFGGQRGQFLSVEVSQNKTKRFQLQRAVSEPFANPTYTLNDLENDSQLGMGCLLPYDEAANTHNTVAACYQIDIFGGADAALCALFAYLLHWAELRTLARHFQRVQRAQQGDHPDYFVASSHDRHDRENNELCVQGPEGLHGFKDAMGRGLKGQARCGLDMIGGPFTFTQGEISLSMVERVPQHAEE